jgi:hypothetical protein
VVTTVAGLLQTEHKAGDEMSIYPTEFDLKELARCKKLIDQAILQEREACAKIVIDIGYDDNPVEAMLPKGIKRMVADQIIEAIRDRK